MGSRWASGDPDEMLGPVALADVVRVLRELEPGFHTVEEIKRRYVELTGVQPSADLAYVSSSVTRLGLRPHRKDYERGWTIDPAALAERWPRLPWSG